MRLWTLGEIVSGSGESFQLVSYDHFGHAPGDTDASNKTACGNGPVETWPQGQLEARLRVTFEQDLPRSVVATTDLVAAAVARQIPPEIPLWVDLYGDPVAEGQLLAALHAHDGGLAPLVGRMLALLTRADHFSVCSQAQRHAMLGQLGLAGRLSAAACHQALVSVLPAMQFGDPLGDPPKPRAESPLRGPVVGADAVVVLWSGGFNTWTDVPTLFEGLSRVMAQEPRLHFVCLGGGIDRHNPGTYDAFVQRVESAEQRTRFHLLGWRSREETMAFVAEADICLNIDAVCHEAELGTRTRLLEWAQAERAICSTSLSEMTRGLVDAEALEPFEPGNAESLSAALLKLARDDARRTTLGKNARAHAETHWTPETAGGELAAWARNPTRAPDRVADQGTNRLIHWMGALEKALDSDQEPPIDLAASIRRLNRLEGSRLVKLRNRLRGKAD
jgi:glycosyltransferase involved in cell wall biosynthesis